MVLVIFMVRGRILHARSVCGLDCWTIAGQGTIYSSLLKTPSVFPCRVALVRTVGNVGPS